MRNCRAAEGATANSLFAVAATRHWKSEGIVANSVNPGGVATGLQRNFTTAQRDSLDAAEAAGVFTYKSIEQGAATSLVAAVAAQFAHTGGHYLDDGQEAYTVPDDATLARLPPRSEGMGTEPRNRRTSLERLDRPRQHLKQRRTGEPNPQLVPRSARSNATSIMPMSLTQNSR